MVVTGVVLVFPTAPRTQAARPERCFWSAGSRWRSLHRSVAVVAAIFLLVVSISGNCFRSIPSRSESMGHPTMQAVCPIPIRMTADLSSRCGFKNSRDAGDNLSAYHAAEGNTRSKCCGCDISAACRKA